MSDSNLIQVSFVREATWGTTPNSTFQEILLTGGTFAHDLATIRSQQIRSDAQAADSKRVGADANATFNVEWSANAFDELLRGGIRSDSDWTTESTIAGTDIAAVDSTNQFTSTVVDLTADLTKGQWIFVAGFTTAANNGWFKVTALSTYALTVTGGTLVDEVAGDSVTIKSSQIRNGTDTASYSLQEEFTDLTNRYNLITGARIGNWDITIAPQAIITGTFGFQGKDIAQAAAKAGDGTVTDAPANDVMSEVDAFDDVWIDNAAIAWDMSQTNMAVSTATRPQGQLGQLAKRGIALGTLTITGGFETYLDDDSWAEQGILFAFTKFSYAYALTDGNGNRYHFEYPQVAYSGEPGEIPAIDTDKMLSFDFEAEAGGSFGAASEEKTIQICRVQA